jgi:hypothetical protein
MDESGAIYTHDKNRGAANAAAKAVNRKGKVWVPLIVVLA